MIEFEIEEFKLEDKENGIKVLKLPDLTEDEINIIDPIVAPTSGLRIQIFDILDDNHYFLPKKNLFLFLRVAKAISEKFKLIKNNQNLKILIVSDDRLSKDILLHYISQIFAYDGYDIYYQEDVPENSRVSSPYGAASVALYDDIDLVIVLTASHNDLSWNGIKFYIDYPIPISGDLFKEISELALNYKEIPLKTDFKPLLIDAIQKNNDYVKKLVANVLEIKSLKNKNIVIWPYLGEARGIVNLFKDYGANVILIEEVINPPNPIKEIREEKLQEVMTKSKSDLALLLDADRDRIALYVKQNEKYFIYIPNEIYSAMHNILAKDFGKKIINIRTIPTDLRSDDTSFMNILTGVGYKHLGVILYFLMGIEVEQSKIDTAILYMQGENKELIKLYNPAPLKRKIIDLMEKQKLEETQFITVMWEESGGHTINILNVSRNPDTKEFLFDSPLPLIADKYPVPALVLITELICRGYIISESIDWSIVGINSTIEAVDEEKVKIMKNFERNHNKNIEIKDKSYSIHALSDNNNMIDIFQLKSQNSTLYFRPSGTGPEVRFYIFGKRETYLDEINTVMDYVKRNYQS